MKLLIMFLLFGYTARATSYYIKNSGSDAAAGTSNGTAWATLAKAKATCVSTDSVFLNKGDTWNENFKITISNFYLGSYGTGNKPVISGLVTASGWTDSSGIWYTTLTNSVPYQNTILIDGVLRAKGRYPNTGSLVCLTLDYNKINIVGSSLPFNFTGAEVVLKNYVWIWDVCKISSISGVGTHDGDTIITQTPLTYNTNFAGTSRYFFQNSVKVLDLNYEWAYDSLTKKLWVKLDHEPTVQYSTIDTLVSNHNNSNVTYDGITITGANRIGFSADSGRNITLKNSSITNSGMNAIGLNKSPQSVVYLNVIQDALNDGLYTKQQSDTCSFTYNSFSRCGIYAGMNLSGNAASLGVFAFGFSINFRHNNIDSVGYNGYEWIIGLRDTVINNYITNFCLTKADGGGIYTDGGAGAETGSLVRSNIVGNGIGYDNANGVAGIYMDNGSTGVRIDSNTVYNIFLGGNIVLNGGTLYTVRNNTVFSNSGHCFKVGNGIAFGTSTIKNNIFYSTYRNLAVDYFGTGTGSSTEDSNYVLRSNATDSLFHDGGSTYYGLAAWRTAVSLDAHSIETFPSGIESAAAGVLYTNPTSSNATVSINGRYKDAAGTTYTNSIVIAPYQSALLFRTTSQPVTSHNIGNLIFD